jgi:hypothetical protein
MLVTSMRVALAQVALLGSAGIAGAGETAAPVRLSADQMDRITAGTVLNVDAWAWFGDAWVVVTPANLGELRKANALGLVVIWGPTLPNPEPCHCGDPKPIPKPGPGPVPGPGPGPGPKNPLEAALTG